MRNPPLYSLRDLDTWVTLAHVLDAHEIIALEQATVEKQRQREERNRR